MERSVSRMDVMRLRNLGNRQRAVWSIAAISRLCSLVRRLSCKKETIKAYEKAIKHYDKNGHAQKINTDSVPDKEVYSMPHHGVIRETSSRTRLQVVFDASSLNTGTLSELEKGPNLNASVSKCISRFIREYSFGSISLCSGDRDTLSFFFLFKKPSYLGEPLARILVTKMSMVPFGATLSPFFFWLLLCSVTSTTSNRYSKKQPLSSRSFFCQ